MKTERPFAVALTTAALLLSTAALPAYAQDKNANPPAAAEVDDDADDRDGDGFDMGWLGLLGLAGLAGLRRNRHDTVRTGTTTTGTRL